MRFFRSLILATVCLGLGFLNIHGQAANGADKADETPRAAVMKKLDYLIGEWAGTGWILIGRERKEFTARESVSLKLGGQIIVVEGIGKTTDEKTGIERIIHQAYGIFSFDDESGKILFRFFKQDGQAGEAVTEFSGNKIIWGFDVPENNVTVRFTEHTTDRDNWLEIGEVSRDGGKTWFKFFEMELSRVK